MTQVAQVMTRGVHSMSPQDSLQMAARAMDELNVGAIPVCEGDNIIGMVTDRDIVVRGVAQSLPPDSAPLRDVMSAEVRTCYEDESLEEVTGRMRDSQIRRLPVLDRQDHLVGILSLGDVAVKGDEIQAAQALTDISEPAEPDRSGMSSGGTTASV